ncbi:unnamed protein product [Rotaria socialis]|uniref:CCHC-type domain-containing protein n=1 Tax=Rotaria socialis TaxID=392032 RepID=A0A818V9R5_9BILA|nr:unnamed protein product [Rotaria socialis]CAF4902360.1 unnamed protein product [Rotaria socialis]
MDAATKQLIQLLTDNLAEQKAANKTQADLLKKYMEGGSSQDNKNFKFKVIEPLIYSLDSTIDLQDFFKTFEKYCAAQYGCADKDSWSAALGKFLQGDISKAYIGLEGGNLKWEQLKTTLTARFSDSITRTRRFLVLFNNISQEAEENLLDLSMRVEKLARQAYPTFTQVNLDILIKEKYLAVVPEEVADKLSIAMIDKDLATTPFEKIVSLAERVQKLVPKTNIVEVARAANTVVSGAAGPSNVQAQATSFRPNGGTGGNLVCTHCSKPGHTIDRCWALQPNLKPARRGNTNDNRGSYNNTGARGGRGNFTNNRGSFTAGARRCYSCGDYGHLANACTGRRSYTNAAPPINLNRPVNTAVANIVDQCIVCGAEGQNFHNFNVCPVRIRQINLANTTPSQNNTNNLAVPSLND